MRWIDLTAHNAALWSAEGPQGERRLILEAIDPSRGIEGLDEAWLATLTEPPPAEASEPPSLEAMFNPAPSANASKWEGGKAWPLKPAFTHNDRGRLIGFRVDHPEADDPRGRLGLSDWLTLAPAASVRDSSTMISAFPPRYANAPEGALRTQWLWAVAVDQISPDHREALGLPDNAPAVIYTPNEAEALRLSSQASPVRDPALLTALRPVDGLDAALYTTEPMAALDPTPAPEPAANTEDEAVEAETESAEGDEPADNEEKRDDYGEKIGGARKDLATRAGINEGAWQKATDEGRLQVDRTTDGQLEVRYNGEALRASRQAARHPKRDKLWPVSEAEDAAPEPGTPLLKPALIRVARQATAESTTRIVPTKPSDPGSLTGWLTLGGAYTAHVQAIRDRIEAIDSDETIVNLISDSLEDQRTFNRLQDQHDAASERFSQTTDPEERRAIEEERRAIWERQVSVTIRHPLVIIHRASSKRQTRRSRGRQVEEITDCIGIDANGALIRPDEGRVLDEDEATVETLNEGITRTVERHAAWARKAPLHYVAASAGAAMVEEVGAIGKALLIETGLVTQEQMDKRGRAAYEAERDKEREREAEGEPLDYRERMHRRKNARKAAENARFAVLEEGLETLRGMSPSALREHIEKRASASAGVDDPTESSASASEKASAPRLVDVIPKVETVRRPTPPRFKHLTREGPSRMEGSVTEAQVAERFGLRGVEYGHWVRQDERQAMLDMAYESFADMAEALGVPDQAIGFDGRLGLALGARGRGGRVAAHYEPTRVVINLTKTMGAGTLAHEWAHALDHELQRRNADIEGRSAGMFLSESALHSLTRSRNPQGGSTMEALFPYNPAVDTDRSAPSVAMLALVRRLLIEDLSGESASAADRHQSPQAHQAGVLEQRMVKRLMRPAVIAQAIDRTMAWYGSGKDDDEANPNWQEIAAQWPKRTRPLLRELADLIETANPGDEHRALLGVCCKRGNVYDRERMVTLANKGLEKDGQPALGEAEQKVFNEWFRIKDLRYLIKQVQRYRRDPNSLNTVTPLTSHMRPTRFYRDACFLESTLRTTATGEPYWNNTRELFARAFSTIIDERLREQGVKNDFATLFSRPGRFCEASGFAASSNPEGEEPAEFAKAAEPLIALVRDLAPDAENREEAEADTAVAMAEFSEADDTAPRNRGAAPPEPR